MIVNQEVKFQVELFNLEKRWLGIEDDLKSIWKVVM
jgi:hypothetical protein